MPYSLDEEGCCVVVDGTLDLGESMTRLPEKASSLFVTLKKVLKEVEKSSRFVCFLKIVLKNFQY